MAKPFTPEEIEQRGRNLEKARQVFTELGGKFSEVHGYPYITSTVYHTEKGTPYLKRPGIVMLAKVQTDITGMRDYLEGYGPELNFGGYVDDPVTLTPAAQLIKVAGQGCYASYGPGRTPNEEADRYIKDIKEDEHGSVLAHPNFSMFIYGISRSVSHEMVRHGVGWVVSQLSQRYVSGRVLRFVERPEYQNDPELHAEFESDIDGHAAKYERRTQMLLSRQKGNSNPLLSAEQRTDRRKRIQQSSRSVLPNETETTMTLTGSSRAFQYTENMRGSIHAETEIRGPYVLALVCLMMSEPQVFADFEIVDYPDGTRGARSPYKKP